MIQIKVSTMDLLRSIIVKTRLSQEEERQLTNRVEASGVSKSEYMRRQLLGTGEMADVYRSLVEIRDLLKANRMDQANTLIIDIAKHFINDSRLKR
jgi:hypothetical protein